MPLIYGEGDNASRRLKKEINERHGRDVTMNSRSTEVRSLGLCLTLAPLIRPEQFVGRAAEIETIHGILRPGETTLEQRRAVVGGMGGIGKTQLVIAYARQQQRSYKSVLWLNASSELTIYASLRSVGGVLFSADELDRLGNEQLLTRVREWLSDPGHTRWLLIFDNYDDPDQFDIGNFCPNIGHGSVIVTTRLPDMVMGSQVRLQPLTAMEESLEILVKRSGRENIKDDVSAHRLAKRLSGLPLALATTGAYLRKSSLTFQEYLDVYDRRWQVDSRRPLHLQEYADRTLYTTWNLSYSQLERQDIDAVRILKLMAYFDNQDIWYDLWYAGLSDHAPAWLRASLADQTSFDSVMSTLVDYCLVEVQHGKQSYSMHSCLHDWSLAVLNQKIEPQLYWYAFDCVAANINKDDWDVLAQVRYARVSRHAVRLTHHRLAVHDDDGLSERLCEAVWIAQMLSDQVQLLAAEQMYMRALSRKEMGLGPEHSSTLITVNNLGTLYTKQGKLNQAEQMYTRALVGRESALGPEHTSTLDTVNNLGALYTKQGKLDHAEQMYTRALVGYETALGSEHTQTLNTVNNLGLLYLKQGKLDKAEQMYQRAQTGYEQASLRLTIPALNTVYNLGCLYQEQGRLNEAEKWFQRAVVGYKQILGSSHVSMTEATNALSQLRLMVTRGPTT